MNTNNYHPDILSLDMVTIDVTHSIDGGQRYCGRSSKFYVVPTEMVINGERDLWKGCPSLVNFDMLKCIEDIEAAGQYPYNSTVGNLFATRFGMAPFDDGTFLSSMVYCTQQYKSSVRDEIDAKALHEKMIGEGYTKCTMEDLKAAADTDKRFFVVMDGTNIFGSEVKNKVEKPLKLKDWKDQGFHWMTAQSTRKGWKAKAGQYIKLVPSKKTAKAIN
jgi:hypothetical protein